MWKKLLDTKYFLRCSDNLDVNVTDYVSIWTLQFSDKSFLDCLKESNFGLEMHDKDFLQKGRHMLTHPEGLKNVRVKIDGNVLVLLLTMSFGFPLKLELNMQEGSKEMFFQMVTSQLLQTVHDLRTSEQELRQILLKKDKELAEYKDEKGQIVFRSLKTKPFNDEAHMSKHTAYDNNFGAVDIPDSLLKMTSVDEPKEINVKQEPTATKNGVIIDVKIEPTIKTEVIKTESSPVKSESQNSSTQSIKSETSDVKMETISVSQHRFAPSPNKRQRKKLNL